jgi:DNA-directed RNA polymerase subunit RPC12/RpoP
MIEIENKYCKHCGAEFLNKVSGLVVELGRPKCPKCGSRLIHIKFSTFDSEEEHCVESKSEEIVCRHSYPCENPQLKLFDIKEESKEEKRERREAKTTIEIIEGLFDLCLKNNNLTDDMSLKHNAIVYKIGKHKTSASSMIDRENMSYCHNEDVIGLENTENGELAFFHKFSLKKTIDSNYSYFAIVLSTYGELRKHFVEYLRNDLDKCSNIVTYLNRTVENKDAIILLRKCITMLKEKVKYIDKIYGSDNDSINNGQ